MKKKLIIPIALLFLFLGCEKVEDLSDKAGIEQFIITSFQPAEARRGGVLVEPGTIYVEVAPQADLFPVTFKADLNVSSSTDDVLGFPGEFLFNSGVSSVNFHLIAESGVPHPYTVKLKAMDTGADIIDFQLPRGEKENINSTIDYWNETILFSANNISFPFTLHPTLVLSAGASTDQESNELTLTFENVNEQKEISVHSSDNKIIRNWKVGFEGLNQIPNSDFESWITEIIGSKEIINIDPEAEKGRGWATANNTYVQGTLPMDYNHGKAASMTTRTQKVPLMGHDLIAAGSLYTGYFSLSLNFKDPRSMTNFGIPHKVRVKAVSFDAQYKAGPQLQQAVPDPSDNDKYRIRDIEGTDQGQAWIELLHWAGEGDLKYNGRPMAGVIVLGRGEFVFDGTDDSFHNWSKITLPVTYTNETLAPTHIAVVFSSSKEGDKFKGAPGSVLNIDNVTLIY